MYKNVFHFFVKSPADMRYDNDNNNGKYFALVALNL